MIPVKIIKREPVVNINGVQLKSESTFNLSANGVLVNSVHPKFREKEIDKDFLKLYGVKFSSEEVTVQEIKDHNESYFFYIELGKYNIKNNYSNIGYLAKIVDKDSNDVYVEFGEQILVGIVFDMRATWGILAGFKRDWDEIWPKLIFADSAGTIIAKNSLKIHEEVCGVSEGVYGVKQMFEEIVLGCATSYFPG